MADFFVEVPLSSEEGLRDGGGPGQGHWRGGWGEGHSVGKGTLKSKRCHGTSLERASNLRQRN